MVKEIYNKVGLHLQQTSYTCGPASLINALALTGLPARDEKEVAELCQAKAGVGTKQDQLVQVAKEIGLTVNSYGADHKISDLERLLDQGCLVIINYISPPSGIGHYGVVVEHDTDVSKDREAFFLFDPASGLFRIGKDHLAKHWFNDEKTIAGWLLALES